MKKATKTPAKRSGGPRACAECGRLGRINRELYEDRKRLVESKLACSIAQQERYDELKSSTDDMRSVLLTQLKTAEDRIHTLESANIPTPLIGLLVVVCLIVGISIGVEYSTPILSFFQ